MGLGGKGSRREDGGVGGQWVYGQVEGGFRKKTVGEKLI